MKRQDYRWHRRKKAESRYKEEWRKDHKNMLSKIFGQKEKRHGKKSS